MTDHNPDHRQRDGDEDEYAARRTLETLRHDGDALGGIFTRWFTPRSVDRDDPMELWGTRIGRGLSVVALLVMCLYLIWVYLR